MTASSQRYQAPELARSRDYFTGIEVGVVLSGSSVLSRYEILPPRFARAPTQPAGSILRTHLWVCSVPQERLPAWQVSCFSRSSEMSSPVTFTLLLTDSFNKSECHFTTCLLATLSENTTSLSKTHLELQATASWATSRTVSRFCHMCSTTTRHGHSTSYTGVS